MKHTRILPPMLRSAMQMGIFLIALIGAAAVGLPSLRGATITVMNTNDNGAGSLRAAIDSAQDGDTINFDVSVTGTITLTSGEVLVNKSITISGPGANTLALDANHASRVLHIAPNKDVTVSRLTITNGLPPDYLGGGIYNDHATLTVSSCTISGNSTIGGFGGGILNDGYGGNATLTVSNCTISGNSSWLGGGINNNLYGGGNATATITNSTFSGNSASYGGAIMNEGATLTLSNSTVSGNSAPLGPYGGGGIYNGGFSGSATLTITNSTFSGNSAPQGGAIVNDLGGALTITNSTLSGNSGGGYPNYIYNGLGGGIYNAQALTITNSTLSGNSADNHGGAIYNTGNNGYAPTILKIGGTILNAGSSGGSIYNDDNYGPATVTSLGYNLSSDNGGGFLTATGDRINTDPMLGPLRDNGGPTLTHLPALNSPAIDSGDPTPETDQRGPGFVRVMNGRIDIGAIEVQAAPSPTPTPTPRPHGRH